MRCHSSGCNSAFEITATGRPSRPGTRRPIRTCGPRSRPRRSDSGTTKAGLLEKERLSTSLNKWSDSCTFRHGHPPHAHRRHLLSLADRAAIANAQRKCVFISIHFDDARQAGGDGNRDLLRCSPGFEFNPRGALVALPAASVSRLGNVESQSLAAFIQEALVTRTQAVNRGTTPQQFFVIASCAIRRCSWKAVFSRIRRS